MRRLAIALSVGAALRLGAQEPAAAPARWWRTRVDLGGMVLRRGAAGPSDRGPAAVARMGRELTGSGGLRWMVGVGGTVAGDGAAVLDAGLEFPVPLPLLLRPVGSVGAGALVGSGVTSSFGRVGAGVAASLTSRLAVTGMLHVGFSRLGRGPHWYLLGVEWRSATRPRPL
ncbi:MAG: hypothetical protein MUE41_04475 [Gemmatimonadaceae bacterium]|nr:hypothetical protein [Gemmatimonadaceae bacterium]